MLGGYPQYFWKVSAACSGTWFWERDHNELSCVPSALYERRPLGPPRFCSIKRCKRYSRDFMGMAIDSSNNSNDMRCLGKSSSFISFFTFTFLISISC